MNEKMVKTLLFLQSISFS